MQRAKKTKKPSPDSSKVLFKKLGHAFKKKSNLEQALIHKSFGNESRSHLPPAERDNERLEFLGDAILDFVISELLADLFPTASEGDLSKRRASLVNEKTLAVVAKKLDLGTYVLLGKGEDRTGGREKDSILSSVFEALTAAIYLDGGLPSVEKWLKKVFKELLVSSGTQSAGQQDFKTRLQEVAQAKFKVGPKYEVIAAVGPDHDKTFTVQIQLQGKVVGRAQGKSKKEAEQNAAKLLLEKFGNTLEGLAL